MSGVVHVLDPYHGPQRPAGRRGDGARATSTRRSQLEGPGTIAAFFLETVTGTNGILIPPDGYLQGVRELCTKYGILMVSDEVMCGFGRTGEWFAVNHWDVVPDIITCAKGLTSSYAAARRARHAAARSPSTSSDNVFFGGLTYNTHPISVAAALATISVYEEDDLMEHTRKMGDVMARHHEELKDKHPSVGAVRNIGLFGALELVKNRETMEPMSPFNVTNEVMASVNRFLLDNGLYTMIHWWTLMTNPPLLHHRGAAVGGVRDHRPRARDRRRGRRGLTAFHGGAGRVRRARHHGSAHGAPSPGGGVPADGALAQPGPGRRPRGSRCGTRHIAG